MGIGTKPTRGHWDPLLRLGYGFSDTLPLIAVGAFAANQTGLDQIQVSNNLIKSKRGAVILSDAQIYIENLGVGASSGNNTYILNQVDSNGNIIKTLATFVVPYNAHTVTAIDLRDQFQNGPQLNPGDILRLDSGTLATGLSTNPSGIKLRITCEPMPPVC